MSQVSDPVPPAAPPPSRGLWFLLCAVWLGGVLVTAMLAWQGWLNEISGEGVADIGLPGCGADEGSCNDVLTSPYSRVAGISLTTLALMFWIAYGAMLVVVRGVSAKSPSVPLSLMLPVLSSLGVAAGGWAVYVMRMQLEHVCHWCMLIHACSLALLVLGAVYAVIDWRYRSALRSERDLPPLTRRPVVLASFTGVVLAVWQVFFLVYFSDPQKPSVVRVVLYSEYLNIKKFNLDPIKELSLPDDAPVATFKGDHDAPDRLVMLTCFSCSYCQSLNSDLRTIMKNHPNRLRVDIRFSPLSFKCNSLHRKKDKVKPKHEWACVTARAAAAVAMVDQTRFAEYIDWLYLNREEMTSEKALTEGRRLIGEDRFNTAFDSPQVEDRLSRDVQLARRYGATSVPRIFIRQGQVTMLRGGGVEQLEQLLVDQFGWDESPY
jgi:uncharacterized membrane protein/protein-disulfide isomerase